MTCIVPGPDITLVAALAALADEPNLVCLAGGPGQPAIVAWGATMRPLAGLDDLPTVTTGRAEVPAAGWPAAIDGGWLVQLDYECPVGPWAAPLAHGQVTGRAMPVEQALRWDADGGCTLLAPDPDTAARLSARLAAASPRSPARVRVTAPLQPAWDQAGHAARVERIRAEIAAGVCYQANLTLPFRGHLQPGVQRDIGLFTELLDSAPGAHAALWRSADRSVVSHSPETFLAADGTGRISSWPIKGTRRRESGQEAAVRAELLAAGKDNAELAMIVDMVRNDLGRIAEARSVRVDRSAVVIDLAYVHHLVAQIEAQTQADHATMLAAAFPAASITGAPKISSMRLIAELEAGPRGAYCGSLGWLGANGAASLSVVIRTAQIAGDQIRIDAGGGIVADSDPAAEWREVLAKAAPLLAAVGSA